MTTPCQHATTAAAFIRDRAIMGREKYGITLSDAALSPAALVQHAREEAADLLVYLTALQASMATAEPEPTAPEWFKAWFALERQKDAARRKVDAEMAKPEPARPAVTREAVMRAVTGASASPKCTKDKGHCIPGGCTCSRTIDAIMALIGGEA